MNTLIIEPNPQLAKQYIAALQSSSYDHQIRAVQTAQEAISAVDESMPDVIVLELLLGSHNGLEFLYELRSYPDTQTTPVIIHTLVPVADFSTDESLFAELGIAQYLYKPETSLQQLAHAVQSARAVNVS